MKRSSSSLNIDATDGLCTIPADVTLEALETELNAAGWTLGYVPDDTKMTVGQALGKRAPNRHALRYGEIDDICLSLTATWHHKKIITKKVSRAATGPDLKQIFIGSGDHYGTITEAILRIVPLPGTRLNVSLGFNNDDDRSKFLKFFSNSGLRPLYCELLGRTVTMELIGPETRLAAETAALKRLASKCRGTVDIA